jgi:hypothetical protein
MTLYFNCQNRGCFTEQYEWDFAMFNGCFGPGKIRPTDIDGLVERNGHGLVIETKAKTVQSVPVGQMRTLEWFARDLKQTVLVMFGDPNAPERAFALYPGGRRVDIEPANVETVRDFVSRWFIWAESTAS